MMASAGGQFAHPGAMPGHALPHGTHPMAAGHPQAPGGVPVSMAQQMHAMGGGGPQPGPGGPMVGMPQNGGPIPNAHALSHLNPSANPQFIQQQQIQQASKFIPLRTLNFPPSHDTRKLLMPKRRRAIVIWRIAALSFYAVSSGRLMRFLSLLFLRRAQLMSSLLSG